MLYKDFLKESRECPFCVKRDQIFWESEHTYLTYAIAPYHPHHLLVLPKRHVISIKELTEAEQKDIQAVQRVAVQILERLGYTSMTGLVREGSSDMRSVEHIHFHMIPEIRIGDLDHAGKEREVMTEDEVLRIVSDIRQVLG